MTVHPDYSRAAAIISREAIAHNLGVVRNAAQADVMAVVKADAYGHGAPEIALLLRDLGVRWLGVALPSEALALRDSGDRGLILAWLLTPGDPAIAECIDRGVDLSVSSGWELAQIARHAQATHQVANIHLKIDTGLSRNGVLLADLDELLVDLVAAVNTGTVCVRGVWSHLASADSADHDLARKSVHDQVVLFESALVALSERGLKPEIRHLSHSAGIFWHPETRYDLVRSGIAIYGLSPNSQRQRANELGLIPAMALEAKLAQVKTVGAGVGVSYSHTWRTERETRVGLVPVGYADGVPRQLSNAISPVVHRTRAPQIGTIAMDQCVIDLGNIDAQAGDRVYLFGSGVHGEPSADEWAEACGSIGYEIVTRMGARLPRIYR